MSAGLKYWDQRWLTAASPGEGSWAGDKAARELEQFWVWRQLKTMEGPILDLGCGAGAIFEPTWYGKAIRQFARERGYLGVDGSLQAVERARTHYPEFRFRQSDLEKEFVDNEGYTILSRRTIQNLAKGVRGSVLQAVSTFRHGCVLEGSLRGMLLTNQVRRVMGYPALNEPEFNTFLDESETAVLLGAKGAKLSWPLGVYYGVTRGLLNRRDVDEAVELCMDMVRTTPEVEERAMGLICGVSW